VLHYNSLKWHLLGKAKATIAESVSKPSALNLPVQWPCREKGEWMPKPLSLLVPVTSKPTLSPSATTVRNREDAPPSSSSEMGPSHADHVSLTQEQRKLKKRSLNPQRGFSSPDTIQTLQVSAQKRSCQNLPYWDSTRKWIITNWSSILEDNGDGWLALVIPGLSTG
jgi:hypothetical protein